MSRIRILLADDHELVRTAIACVLEDEPDFEIVGHAANGTEAILRVQQYDPDVVVMDVDMPRVDGVNATRLILGTWPNVRVVGLSVCNEEAVVNRMLEAGVFAFINKSSPMSALVEAIRDAAAVNA